MKNRAVISPSLNSQGALMSNSRLGIILFIASELMLFVGLIASYVVLRYGSGNFAGMSPLPIGLTAISSPLLILSSITLFLGSRALKRGEYQRFRSSTFVTFVLGLAFMVFQIIEWNQLIAAGIDPAKNVRGGMFYMLSWAHGAHVLGGVVLLAVLSFRVLRNRITEKQKGFLSVTAIYWHFVTLMWVAIFAMLFL